MGIVACSTHAGDSSESEQSQSALVTSYESFESYPVGRWNQGETHGKWRVVFDGYGTVKVKATDTAHGQVLNLAPAAPASSGETHAALVAGTQSFGDLDVNVSLRTAQQLRTSPNPWEVGWFAWHYADAGHFYYLILKPNGWELGKRDPAYPGGQRFLATGGSPTFPTGAWHGIRVQQTGNSITVTADGKPLTTFVDQERPYLSGALGLYSEDAVVNFDDITMNSSSSTTTADAGTTPTTTVDSGTTTTTTQPAKMYGVTVDAVDHLSNIVDSLKRLPHKPTTRIVFDEYVPATDYTNAATQIQSVSYVMGELLDSFYVKQYSTAAYLARTDEYLSTLGNKVDIWEVGNEINGEWLGDTPTVVAKMTGAYDKVKAAGKTTELTPYYNAGCWEKSDHEMFTWAQANIPQRM
jgi:hypothetical protein